MYFEILIAFEEMRGEKWFFLILPFFTRSRKVRESPVFPAKDSSRRFYLVFSPLSLNQMDFFSHCMRFY